MGNSSETEKAGLPAPVEADAQEVIRALSTWIFRDARAPYARNLASGESVFLDSFSLGLLDQARSFGSPREHTSAFLAPYGGLAKLRLWRSVVRRQLEGGGPVRLTGLLHVAACDVLNSLHTQGIVQSRAEFVGALQQAAGEPEELPAIQTLAIPTAGRPEILRRALDSYLDWFKGQGRSMRVLVSDDSADPAIASANRQVAADAASRHGAVVEYLGMDQRRRLIGERSGGDPHRRQALEFLLCDDQGLGQTFGMARNAILLATLGERVVCADDDTLCQAWRSPAYRAGLEYWDESNGAASTPVDHDSEESARASLRPWEGDWLALHDRFLGRASAHALLGEASNAAFTVGTLGARAARRLRGADDRIAFTVNGLVGDSGSAVTSASALTFLSSAQVQGHLAAGRDLLQLVDKRLVTKVPDWARVSSRDNVMTTSYGHDNRRWSVPFFPWLRGEDQIFKEMLIRSDASAEIAYLPVALEHAPVATRRGSPSPVTLFDMLLAALNDIPRPGPGASAVDRVRELGNRLAAFADLPLSAFRREVFGLVGVFTAQEIAQHRSFLSANRGIPGQAMDAVKASLAGLEAFLRQKHVVCAEGPWIAHFGSAEKAEEASRRALRQFGEATVSLAGI